MEVNAPTVTLVEPNLEAQIVTAAICQDQIVAAHFLKEVGFPGWFSKKVTFLVRSFLEPTYAEQI